MASKLLLAILLLYTNSSIMAQTSVDEMDKALRKDTKHRLKKIKFKTNILLRNIFYYKSNKQIFSIMTNERYKSKNKTDSSIYFQFCYINDSLIRVWYQKLDPSIHKNETSILYISHNEIIALKQNGRFTIPSLPIIVDKSKEAMSMAKQFIEKVD